MTSSGLLPSVFPLAEELDETILARLDEAERSREWWKRRVSVLDIRCREINAQLRDALTENKRYCSHQRLPSSVVLVGVADM